MIDILKRLLRLPAAVSCALALSACGLTLDSAERSTAPGGAFEAGLHAAYLDLARAEYDEADYRDADSFARRALALSRGGSVAPDAAEARRLPADSVGELTDARARLTAALDKSAATKAPDLAASAQANFDCWIQEQEENRQPADIAACRSGFMTAMASVDEALAPPPEPAPEPAPPPEAPRVWTILFDFDSAGLDADARGVVARILSGWAMKPDAIVVTGHTDAAGPARYNQDLSERRAAAVGQALEEGGIDPGRITAVGKGEAEPAVPTADGVRESQNRRVTVDVE